MIVRLVIKHGGRSNTGIFGPIKRVSYHPIHCHQLRESKRGIAVWIMANQLPNDGARRLVFQNRGTV